MGLIGIVIVLVVFFLIRRVDLRDCFTRLIGGLLNVTSDLNRAKERIGCSTATHVVGTLADAQEQIRLLIQPLLIRPRKQLQPDCGHTIMV